VTRPFGPQAHVASGYCFAFDVANNKVSAMLALTAGEGGFYEPLISNYVGLVSVARLAFHQSSPVRPRQISTTAGQNLRRWAASPRRSCSTCRAGAVTVVLALNVLQWRVIAHLPEPSPEKPIGPLEPND
jgi:hypothetical protein